MEQTCPKCGKIIIKDIELYLARYPNEKWMQCPYCGYHFLIESLKVQNKFERRER